MDFFTNTLHAAALAAALTFSVSTASAQNCPTFTIVDQLGLPGAPQPNDLVTCGGGDTISVMVYSDWHESIFGATLTVNLPQGLEFAGAFGNNLPGAIPSIFDASDLQNPVFLFDRIDECMASMFWLTIRANCSVVPSGGPMRVHYRMDAVVDGNDCYAIAASEVALNGYVKRPSFSVIHSPGVVAATGRGVEIQQWIRVRQETPGAHVDSLKFRVRGLDLNSPDYQVSAIRFWWGAEILPPLTQYIQPNGDLLVNVPASSFSYGPVGDGDTRLEHNETMYVGLGFKFQECYSSTIELDYAINWGCTGNTCDEWLERHGSVQYKPDFGVTPSATAALVQPMQVCGQNALVNFTVKGSNNHPVDGVMNDLRLGTELCQNENISVIGGSIGGNALPMSVFSVDAGNISVDLTKLPVSFGDPDGVGVGITDTDGDGFFDDLPGGKTLTFQLEIGLACSDPALSAQSCGGLNCEIKDLRVEGRKNCGQPFQHFPGITPTIQFTNGATSISTNETDVYYGIIGYDFGVSGTNQEPNDIEKRINVEFCHTYEQNGITPCAGASSFLEIVVRTLPVLAKDIQIVPTSATWAGAAVLPSNVITVADSVEKGVKIFRILAGNNTFGLDQCYEFQLAMDTCVCIPFQFMSMDMRVVEICPACGGGACQTVRACEKAMLKTDPDCSPCDCDLYAKIEEIRRLNYGYTDQTLATPHTHLTADVADLNRYLPGDTMLVKVSYEILDSVELWNGDYLFYLQLDWRTVTQTSQDFHKTLLVPDLENAWFEAFQIQKAATGAFTTIDPSLSGTNFDTGTSIRILGTKNGLPNTHHPPGYWRYSDSSLDGYDTRIFQLSMYNFDSYPYNGVPGYQGDAIKWLLDTYKPGNGDKFWITLKVPLQRNPQVEIYNLLPADIQTPQVLPHGLTYKRVPDPALNDASQASNHCYSTANYEEFDPGDVVESAVINLDNCPATIEHTFSLAKPTPLNWYLNEYRPIIKVDSITAPLMSPLYMTGNAATLTNVLGMTSSLPVFDRYDMNCQTVAGNYYCQSQVGKTGRLFFKNTTKKLRLGVGKGNGDFFKLSYPVGQICPDRLEGVPGYKVDFTWGFDNPFNASGFLCSHIADEPMHSLYNDYVAPPCKISAIEYQNYVNATGRGFFHHFRKSSFVNSFTDNSQDFPVLSNTVSSSALFSTGGTETTTYEVCAGTLSGTATHTNVATALTVKNSIQVVSIKNHAGGAAMPFSQVYATDSTTTYAVALPNLAPGACFSIDIETKLVFCQPGNPTLKARTTSGCLPANVTAALTSSGADACQAAEASFFYATQPASMAASWPVQPAPFSVQICNEMTFQNRVSNTATTPIGNPKPVWRLPSGVEFVPGSFEAVYPGGPATVGTWTAIPDPTVQADLSDAAGTAFSYANTAAWASGLGITFLPAMNATSTTDDLNKVSFRFRVRQVCGEFTSGSQLDFEMKGINGCGVPISSGRAATAPMTMAGANIPVARIRTEASANKIFCGVSPNTITIKGYNFGTLATNDSTEMTLTFPSSLGYVAGSIAFKLPAGFQPPYLFETTANGLTKIRFELPANIAIGKVLEFDMGVTVGPNSVCGPIEMGVQVRSYVPQVCAATGQDCGFWISNSINPTVDFEVLPPLEDVEMSLFEKCAPLGTAKYGYKVILKNPSNAAFSGNVEIELRRDLDGNGQLDSYDPVLDSETRFVSLAAGAIATLLGEMEAPQSIGCPIFLNLRTPPGCACRERSRLISEIKPEFLFEKGEEPITLCPGQNIEESVCEGWTWTLSPVAAGTASVAGSTLLVNINPGFGVVSPVILTGKNNLLGTCEREYSCTIFRLENFAFGPYTKNICENQCAFLNLNLPESVKTSASIQWSPATFLDDPTSFTPRACDVTQPTTYSVEIDFGGCQYSTTYQLNPTPQNAMTLNTHDSIICDGMTTVLTAETGFTNYIFYKKDVPNNRWIAVKSGPTNTFSTAETGFYRVEGIKPNACRSVSNEVWLKCVRDFGDLPPTFNTALSDNGPRHVLDDKIYLGPSVDGEADGQPNNMAGAMTGGDDFTNGTDRQGAGADDENGVIFDAPMIAGSVSCVKITARNATASAAFLTAWIDFNGNAQFDAGEKLTSGDFAGGRFLVPVGGVSAFKACFDVPANATFAGGKAFSRFRISSNLTAISTPEGSAPDGEIEDYKTPLAKLGNLVWHDQNGDGQQNEPTSAGLDGVAVQLTFFGEDGVLGGGDDRVFSTTTANLGGISGKYGFCGLVAGNYSIAVPTLPTATEPTILNTGDDQKDSENPAGEAFSITDVLNLFTAENGTGDDPTATTWPDQQNDLRFDFGVLARDLGDLPDSYATTKGATGASALVSPKLHLGACVDADLDGQPSILAAGDDAPPSAATIIGGSCAGGDDEDGVIFKTPLIAGEMACIELSASNTTGATAKIQGWIDFNGNGFFEANEQLSTLDFATAGGATVPAAGLSNQNFCFQVPASATFAGGQMMARFRISETGNLAATGAAGIGEVEDYRLALGKIGSLVWHDYNNDGLQNEPSAAGLNGVTVRLLWFGADAQKGTSDDRIFEKITASATVAGEYAFCGLTSGSYEVSVPTAPAGLVEGRKNEGTDDDLDAEPTAGIFVSILPNFGLPTGENGTGDLPGAAGWPDGQDQINLDFNFIGIDFGDLPDTYGTTDGQNGPEHAIDPRLKLGSKIDSDPNGSPDSMAGQMTGGDDNSAGLFAVGGAGDDEDGIVFKGPMIAGATACVEVSAMNMTASAAKIQGWIDFNGNGVFEGNEALTGGDFSNPLGATVPVGGFLNQKLCFDVPFSATFEGGKAMSRFRLSPLGGLQATGVLADGNLPTGEVEDYKTTLGKVGSLVWHDYNNDGLQNENASAGLNGVTVRLLWLGEDDVKGSSDDRFFDQTTATGDVAGEYAFCGLTAGNYEISIPTAPTGLLGGRQNEGGDDDLDSENPAGSTFSIASTFGLPTSENGTGDNPGAANWPDGQDQINFDFNFIGLDFGDAPDTYGTTTGQNGPQHAVDPSLKIGQKIDADSNGQPDAMAGLMTGGDDNSAGLFNAGGAGNDEDGVVLTTPMVPGMEACLSVSAMNMTASAARLQGWIDFNGNGIFENSEAISGGDFSNPLGATVPVGGLLAQKMCFTVPVSATFAGGQAMMRFRLSPLGGLSATGPTTLAATPTGEVEDQKVALAKIGQLVWQDYNNDGLQNEPASAGINGVTVRVIWYGSDGQKGTADDRIFEKVTATGDVAGEWAVCGLIAGAYEILIPTTPAGLETGIQNAGSNDAQDSENPAGVVVQILPTFGLPTAENGTGDNPTADNFPDGQDNYTIDFNFIGIDRGDLPDSYSTTKSQNGPAHAIDPSLKMGQKIDADANGQPSADTRGDDSNDGLFSIGGAGDDEDGVRLDGPLLAGQTACLEVSAMNMTAAPAVLQGWIDFNGNGILEANEQLAGGDFGGSGSGATVPVGGFLNQKLCFLVPASATFPTGEAMMRFRLSPEGNLLAAGPKTDGAMPTGEVEDYREPLAKVGSIVWHDYDANGIQNEPSASGINAMQVVLTYFGLDGVAGGGDDRTFSTTTSTMNGQPGSYMFVGLPSGNYSISVPPLAGGWSSSPTGQGTPATDSNDPSGVPFSIGSPISLILNENGLGDQPGSTPGFGDASDNLTFDFGVIARDFGDQPDTYKTTLVASGPSALLSPNLLLGTCADAEISGQADQMAGRMGGGDDGNASGVSVGNCTSADDEDGLLLFDGPMMAGFEACWRVTAQNTTGATARLQAWVDWNGDGIFQLSEELTTGAFVQSAGAPIPNGGVTNQAFCFQVPADANFENGSARVRLRISTTGDLGPDGPDTGGKIGEIEDYKMPLAKVGNLVWADWNNDGLQNEPALAGLNGAEIKLTWAGQDLAFSTADDRVFTAITAQKGGVDGKYAFCGLTPGEYKIEVLTIPAGFEKTQIDRGSDIFDADPTEAFAFSIADPINLKTGENATGDDPNLTGGFPDAQNDLAFDYGFIATDYGDQPDSYLTTDSKTGPQHSIMPLLFLGQKIDDENDGSADAMAGMMTGGDDNSASLFSIGGAGDDEDGLFLESPMVPGTTACVTATAKNDLGSAARLQGWIDWNGDGIFQNSEELAGGDFAAGLGATVPAGGFLNQKLCFDVPASAAFAASGDARVRWRLSPMGGLLASGPAAMPFPMGEIEDYKWPLSKIGNLVWNDYNNDGLQNEPILNGFDGVLVKMEWGGPDQNLATTADNRIYTTTTATENGVSGKYSFCGLAAGIYQVSVPTAPADFVPTQVEKGSNAAADSHDPTGKTITITDPTGLFQNENGTGDQPTVGNFGDRQTDLTLDFGFFAQDFGDLPDSYSTQISAGGPRHVVNPNLFLGTSVDSDLDGKPDAMAGAMTGGDDNSAGLKNEGGAGDDENGVVFATPMIAGNSACLKITARNSTGATAFLQGWIDFNGNGFFDQNEELKSGAFSPANGAAIPVGGVSGQLFCFDVPTSATFEGGKAMARFRISPSGGNGSGGSSAMPFPVGEVEDYKIELAKVGNWVWLDLNADGQQNESPLLGLPGKNIELVWGGDDQNLATAFDNKTFATTTDAAGKYGFCGLISGAYSVRVSGVKNPPTRINVGSDVSDSDDPAGAAVTISDPISQVLGENSTNDDPGATNGFEDRKDDLTLDFGFLALDYGDLPDSYLTTDSKNGAVHTLDPDLFLGSSVDAEGDGAPDSKAGRLVGGDDGASANAAASTLGVSTVLGDDENGVSFPTPLVPGSAACVKVTAKNTSSAAAFLQAWMDWNGNGLFENSEKLATGDFLGGQKTVAVGGFSAQNLCFDVPATARFEGGNLLVRFRISATGGLDASGPSLLATLPNGEVEDYTLPLALVGNYVWMDSPDLEGDQDAAETALGDVEILMTWAGENGVFETAWNATTATGDDKMYASMTEGRGRFEFRGLQPDANFRLLPKKYTAADAATGDQIEPKNAILTVRDNLSNDVKDSDGNPFVLVSTPDLTTVFLKNGENGEQDTPGQLGFPDAHDDLSIDFGFVEKPVFGIALRIAGYAEAASGHCGQFVLKMAACLENTSTVPLADDQIAMNISTADAFGSAFYGLATATAVEIVSSDAQETPGLNANFDGTAANLNVFDGTSGLVWPSEKVCVDITFEVNPNAPGAPSAPKSSVTVSGKAVNYQNQPILDYFNGGQQFLAFDVSDDGTDATTNNGSGGMSDPTFLGACFLSTQSLVAHDLVNVSIDGNCQYWVTEATILQGLDPDCAGLGLFEIKITTLAGAPVPNPIPASYIGQMLIVAVRNVVSCNTTWGKILLEDKLPPIISCPPNVTILCTQSEDNLALTGQPTVTDCTAGVQITRTDSYQQFTCAQNATISTRIVRTWIATDQWGKSATCTQTIDQKGGDLADVLFPGDREFSCTAAPASLEPTTTGWPTVGGTNLTTAGTGACGLGVAFSDVEFFPCPGSKKVERTWKITDWCTPTGQPTTKTAVQYLKILDEKPTVSFDTTWLWDAGGFFIIPATGKNAQGVCVAGNLFPKAILDGVCNSVIYEKLVTPVGIIQNGGQIPAPGLAQGFHDVTYIVKDECGNITEKTITVLVKDLFPPAVICQEFTQIALGHDGKAIVLADNFNSGTYDNCCLDRVEVRRMDGLCPGGQADDFGPTVEFCCGDIGDTVNVILRATDCAGNESECMIQAFVEDKLKPTCLAPPHVTTDCENFDPLLWYGDLVAFDNCAVVNIDTSISYDGVGSGTAAQEKAAFESCNFGRVTRRFSVFDAAGNSSVCQQTITVNYREQYRVEWPNDRTLTACDAAVDTVGPRIFSENCETIGVSFEDEIFTVVPDACFKIIRTWRVINWCTYSPTLPEVLIQKQNLNSPNGPNTWIGAGWRHAQANPAGGFIVPTTGAGSPLLISVPAGTINSAALSAPGTPAYAYIQVLKVQDQQDPTIVVAPFDPCDYTDNDVDGNAPAVRARHAQLWNGSAFWDPTCQSHDLCEGSKQLFIDAADACSKGQVNARYQLFLDLNGDGVMETVVNSEQPTLRFGIGVEQIAANGSSSLLPSISGSVNDPVLTVSNGNAPTADQIEKAVKRRFFVTRDPEWDAQFPQTADRFLKDVDLPYGKHKIKWTVEDNCGNDVTTEQFFEVKDCKKPTLICKPLAGPIMNGPAQMVTVWATDFVEYAEDNCCLDAGWYSIRKEGAGFGSGQPPLGPNGSPIASVTFSCADPLTAQVEIWTRDLAGNYDFCVTYIQLNKQNCGSQPGQATIAGALKTEPTFGQNGVAEAKVQLAGSAPGIPSPTIFTGDDGIFDFTGIPLGQDYTVTPTKDINPTNGVSTFDLVLISKHILGAEPFSTPYKWVAADVNKSGTVSTADIVELRKLILGIVPDFPSNESWRFVASDYAFTTANPAGESFAESATVAQLAASENRDFVAVKIGDINGNAAANGLMNADDRSPVGKIVFETEDQNVEKGQLFEALFTARDLEKVAGWQFTLLFDGLEIVDLRAEKGLTAENFGVFKTEKPVPNASSGRLTASWNGSQKEAVFVLKFRAEKAGRLLEMLKISSQITRAEGYSKTGEPLAIELRGAQKTAVSTAFVLEQNEPNPFADRTSISFFLPEATEATLTIFEPTGRQVLAKKVAGQKGWNRIEVEKAQLGAPSGAFFYRLETANDSAVRTMILTR